MRHRLRILPLLDSNAPLQRSRSFLEPVCIFCQHGSAFSRRQIAPFPPSQTRTNTTKKDVYTPATTWHGLERIGGEKEVDLGWRFESFPPSSPPTEPHAIEAGLRQALAVVVSSVEASTSSSLQIGSNGSELLEPTRQTLLKFPSNKSTSWGQSWLEIPLKDPVLKFAILKEFYRITGIRIIDPLIVKAESILNILQYAIKPKPPKKLAESLLTDDSIIGLANINISAKRRTPIDQDKNIGRWKVIRKELIERNLPLPGKRGRTAWVRP